MFLDGVRNEVSPFAAGAPAGRAAMSEASASTEARASRIARILHSTGECRKPPVVEGGFRVRRPGELLADAAADLLECLADQARHVHLRDADLLRDLGLREVLDEAQVQHQPVAFRKRTQLRPERGGVLRELVAGVLAAEA